MVLTEKDLNKIEETAQKLATHLMELGCDSVRVLASATIKQQQTAAFTVGAGNLFAQEALARNWLVEREMVYASGMDSGEVGI